MDHAAFERQHSKTEAARMVIRERIGELLNTHWDALTAEGPAKDEQIPSDPDEEIASGGVDKNMWEEFKAELAKVERVLDEGPRVVSPLETEEIARLQYIAPSGPSSSTARIARDDVPFDIVEKGAGGDCLFLALGEKQKDIEAVRGKIALAILTREDNEQARNRNAHHVAAALYQTPGEAQDHAAGLTYGRHAIPNSVYAKLVAIPGIYAGDDELGLYSTLPANQGKTFVVVDQDGTLLRVKNGESERILFTDENKAQVLHETLTNADVALYKTPIHWQQIALPGKIAENTVEQDFLDATFTDEVRLLLEMLKEGDEEDVDLAEPQDNTHIANTGAIHAVAGGTATDPFNLQRFLNAQARNASGSTIYDTARAELKAGVKMGHWMWYMFPIMQGIAYKPSETNKKYAISSLQEAQAYLADPVLGPRLLDFAALVLGWLEDGRNLDVILGKPDDWKFKASMTLFAEATKDAPTGPNKVFHDCVASHGRDYKTDQQLRALAAGAGA